MFKVRQAMDDYIRNMEEIRAGWITDVFNVIKKTKFKEIEVKEDYCFSIIFANGNITNLVATNSSTRDSWVRGLSFLVAAYKNDLENKQKDVWLKEQFRNADKNENGSLNYTECKNLVNQLNIYMDDDDLKSYFDAANFRKKSVTEEEEALDEDEFVTFFHSLKDRPELNIIFNQHCIPKSSVWTPDMLHAFLTKEQHMHGVTLEDCKKIITEFSSEAFSIPVLTREGFENLLLSEYGDMFNKSHKTVYQDMTKPLTHYYIASSHNTYLLGDQIFGSSSIEGYIRALKKGCRCLEIDVHNGDEDPVVYHGNTLTSVVLFSDVIEAIQAYAFHSSPYPLILSLENHCDVEQQRIMAYHLVNILGDYLYRTPVSRLERVHPSPEDLKYKILIKGKKIKNPRASIEVIVDKEDEFDELPDDQFVRQLMEKHEKMNLAKELSDLVNYFESSSFESFQNSLSTWKFYQIASFSELKASHLEAINSKGFIKYNMRFLSRIYPKGTRAASNNYIPIPMWNLGCQLVALNYQTNDMAMILNDAKFSTNGNCGYVLKPDFLINVEENFDTKEFPAAKYHRVMFLKIISGQHIPKTSGETAAGPIVDPYVAVRVLGLPQDQTIKKTVYISNNGFNPMWEESFEFSISMPELAIVVFMVRDYNMGISDKLVAYAAYPVMSMTQGYRHIHLKDPYGNPLLTATLFVYMTLNAG